MVKKSDRLEKAMRSNVFLAVITDNGAGVRGRYFVPSGERLVFDILQKNDVVDLGACLLLLLLETKTIYGETK